MAKITLITAVLFVMAGLAYLALSTVPAPTQAVSKTIPVEEFFK